MVLGAHRYFIQVLPLNGYCGAAGKVYICNMEKQTQFDKKDLKKRLSFVMMAQMDGLSEKRKEKLEKYLDKQLNDIVDRYRELLEKKEKKKKQGKDILLSPASGQDHQASA